jgi:hypothetical protein
MLMSGSRGFAAPGEEKNGYGDGAIIGMLPAMRNEVGTRLWTHSQSMNIISCSSMEALDPKHVRSYDKPLTRLHPLQYHQRQTSLLQSLSTFPWFSPPSLASLSLSPPFPPSSPSSLPPS